MVNSPFFYNQVGIIFDKIVQPLPTARCWEYPVKWWFFGSGKISPNILLVSYPKDPGMSLDLGITPAFLFWIGTLNPLLGKDLDP